MLCILLITMCLLDFSLYIYPTFFPKDWFSFDFLNCIECNCGSLFWKILHLLLSPLISGDFHVGSIEFYFWQVLLSAYFFLCFEIRWITFSVFPVAVVLSRLISVTISGRRSFSTIVYFPWSCVTNGGNGRASSRRPQDCLPGKSWTSTLFYPDPGIKVLSVKVHILLKV